MRAGDPTAGPQLRGKPAAGVPGSALQQCGQQGGGGHEIFVISFSSGLDFDAEKPPFCLLQTFLSVRKIKGNGFSYTKFLLKENFEKFVKILYNLADIILQNLLNFFPSTFDFFYKILGETSRESLHTFCLNFARKNLDVQTSRNIFTKM